MLSDAFGVPKDKWTKWPFGKVHEWTDSRESWNRLLVSEVSFSSLTYSISLELWSRAAACFVRLNDGISDLHGLTPKILFSFRKSHYDLKSRAPSEEMVACRHKARYSKRLNSTKPIYLMLLGSFNLSVCKDWTVFSLFRHYRVSASTDLRQLNLDSLMQDRVLRVPFVFVRRKKVARGVYPYPYRRDLGKASL